MINQDEIARIIDENNKLSATTKADLKAELNDINDKIKSMKSSIDNLKKTIDDEKELKNSQEKLSLIEQFEVEHSSFTKALNSFFQLLSNSGI
ncbi:hypothetical protein AAEX28_00845 [Lentisphaerota bacterium WC36G]|nr:DUF4404 family protein [Lentisphaerae bacterium WC36]